MTNQSGVWDMAMIDGFEKWLNGKQRPSRLSFTDGAASVETLKQVTGVTKEALGLEGGVDL